MSNINLGKILKTDFDIKSGNIITELSDERNDFSVNSIANIIIAGNDSCEKAKVAAKLASETVKALNKDDISYRAICINMDDTNHFKNEHFEAPVYSYTADNLYFNPFIVPDNISVTKWIHGIVNVYSNAYGFLEKGKDMFANAVYAVYAEADAITDNKKSSKVTFEKLYNKMIELSEKEKGFKKDAWKRLSDRLAAFSHDSIEKEKFSSNKSVGIDQIFYEKGTYLLSLDGIECTFANFIFSFIVHAYSIYRKTLIRKNFEIADKSRTYFYINDHADKILFGATNEQTLIYNNSESKTNANPTVFNQIYNIGTALGINIIAATSRFSEMPYAFLKNTQTLIIGRNKMPNDITCITETLCGDITVSHGTIPLDVSILSQWLPKFEDNHFMIKNTSPQLNEIKLIEITE